MLNAADATALVVEPKLNATALNVNGEADADEADVLTVVTGLAMVEGLAAPAVGPIDAAAKGLMRSLRV